VLLLLFLVNDSFAQSLAVSGKVLSETDKSPVAGETQFRVGKRNINVVDKLYPRRNVDNNGRRFLFQK